MPDNRPLDARLAARLVYPLRHTALTPNHLTSARLLFGAGACALLSTGEPAQANAGALCFVVSAFLDHTDGELARLTDNKSKTGHYYDLASDAIVNILLFIGIGFGLMGGDLGRGALLVGVLAGTGVAAVFHLRLLLSNMMGKDRIEQPNIGLFEIEDVFYLLPVVTYFEWLQPFLILASIGAPLFALWTLRDYLKLRRR